MVELFLLGTVLAGAGYAWSAMRARERALDVSRNACSRDGVQLLDETVHCVKLRLRRDEDVKLRWARSYRFEFSESGDSRRAGGVELLGEHVQSVYMDPYPYPMQDDASNDIRRIH